MAQLIKPTSDLAFPPHQNQVRAEWAPLYIEPMVNSGERITIGVAVVNQSGFLVVPVVALERLSSIYGNENQALLFAAHSALDTLKATLVHEGQLGLKKWKSPFEGIFMGTIKSGSGKSLEDIARTGLSLCASLVEKLSEAEDTEESRSSISESRLEKLVKEKVIGARPGLNLAFGRSFQPDSRARSAKINFVGQRIAANFSLLVPHNLSLNVKMAKAKLWDLAQLQEYVTGREFNLSPDLNQFELLIHRVREDDPQYSDKQIEQTQEAVHELEIEADKKEIRCRPLYGPEEMAQIIIEAEAA